MGNFKIAASWACYEPNANASTLTLLIAHYTSTGRARALTTYFLTPGSSGARGVGMPSNP